MYSYHYRKNFTSWPNVQKIPFNIASVDSCPRFNDTVAPIPVLGIAPYLCGFANPNPTVPYNATAGITIGNVTLNLGLCQTYTNARAFCPVKDNARMTPITQWILDSEEQKNTHAIQNDSSVLESMALLECTSRCRNSLDGTAYIGGQETLPYGVEYSERLPSKEPKLNFTGICNFLKSRNIPDSANQTKNGKLLECLPSYPEVGDLNTTAFLSYVG